MRAPRYLALGLACALLAGTNVPSQAAPAKKESSAANAKKKSAMPTFIPSSSQETRQERERRLLRECKGRPNAGSCSGFTG